MAWIAPTLEAAKLLVDLFKAALWPALVLTFLFLFRSQVASAIPRLKEIGLKGASFTDTSGGQANAEQTLTKPGAAVPQPPPTPATHIVEGRLRQNAAAIDPGHLEDHLFRLTASAQLYAHYCRVYIAIFGSQIELLKRLNEIGSSNVAIAQLRYSAAAHNFPDIYDKWPLNDWINFLVSTELISREGDMLSITDVGVEFLAFLPQQKLTENKVG
jgi:hypothetical protein